MRNTILPLMAQLMLKNHRELSELVQSRLAIPVHLRGPMTLDCQAGSSRSHMSVTQPGNIIELTFSEDGGKHFGIRVPLNAQLQELPLIEVLWREANSADGVIHRKLISAEKFLTWEPPQGLKELHSKLVSHLTTLVPASVLKALGLEKKVAAEKDAVPTETAAQPSAAEPASTEADDQRGDPVAPAEAAAAQAGQPTDEFRRYEVRRENQPDLHFEGRLIAHAASLPHQGRQYVLDVFETRSGKFVALRRGHTMWVGERDRIEAGVFATKAELPSFFGYGVLAKHIYAQLDINAAEVIE